MTPTLPSLALLLASAAMAAQAQPAQTGAPQRAIGEAPAFGAPTLGGPSPASPRPGPPAAETEDPTAQNPVGLQEMLERIQRGTATPTAPQQPVRR